MRFKDILENELNEARGVTVSIQVINPSNFIDTLNGKGIPARRSKRHQDEVEVDLTAPEIKHTLYKTMLKAGWDKEDIEDLYPEILESKLNEALIDKLEKFAASKIKPGRNVIKGYPVDIEDSDGSYIEMEAVDRDACTGLVKELRDAGFKAKRIGNTGISIEK